MIELRPPSIVMRLSRLGSMHQCRLSFMRQLTRRLASENWQFTCPQFEIDSNCVGHAVYTVCGPGHTYSLVAFSHDLPDELRSDRVIATAWDATFVLFDGVPSDTDISKLSKNVPLQEAGRLSEREIILSRANKSARLWNHTVDALSNGRQPDMEKLDSVGYLMRTTAVYGSGKFGLADRESIAVRPEFRAPFQAEMLLVYMVRTFVRDLVNRMAEIKGGSRSVRLDPVVAKNLGIGNSTGLGMAPFIVNHPVLFNNWIHARETAIARVRSVRTATEKEVLTFHEMLSRSTVQVEQWQTEHPIQKNRIEGLKIDLEKLHSHLEAEGIETELPWNELVNWSVANLGEEAQELVASMILESYPDLVDDLGTGMSDDNADAYIIDGGMPVGRAVELIRKNFDWATGLDWENRGNCARVWYVSEEKLEPRLGERFEEPVSEYEQPLSPARDASNAYKVIKNWDMDRPVADFLAAHPEHRHTIRRAQISDNAHYSEIHDNTISAEMIPIDLLRVKLSFFGATHFDPRSDRWIRIRMYAGAPYPENLTRENSDLWVYPETA